MGVCITLPYLQEGKPPSYIFELVVDNIFRRSVGHAAVCWSPQKALHVKRRASAGLAIPVLPHLRVPVEDATLLKKKAGVKITVGARTNSMDSSHTMTSAVDSPNACT